MERASESLLMYYKEFQEEFYTFFPLLIDFVAENK
jgi:hypothetical protein